MTLPASGAISLADLATEYGRDVSAPFPSSYYGLPGIPTSGALGLMEFYGKQAVAFSPDGGALSDADTYVASITLTCTVAAVWTYTGGADGSANVASGGSATSITFLLTTSKFSRSASFAVAGLANGITRNFTIDLSVFGDNP